MKKMISAAMALAMAFSLTACGQSTASSAVSVAASSAAVSSEAAASSQAESEAAAFPVTVTDQAGREITINQEPKKIASGYYISTSALIALGAQNRMAGIEENADQRAIYKLSAPELIDLPSIGSAKAFNVENCAEVEPDLVILPLKLQTAAELLVEMGIQVLYVNPESEQDLEYMITMLGQATGTSEKAEQLLAFTEETGYSLAGMLEEKLTDTSLVPSVYIAGNSDLLSTAGGQMYQSSMVELAGGSNVAAELKDTYWADVSYEQLLAWDPDWIVLTSDASYTVDDVLQDANLADCTAVKEGHVVQMPGDVEAWDSPVPSGVLGSVWLAGRMHPDAVSEEYVNSTIENFYQTFYGFDYAEATRENN